MVTRRISPLVRQTHSWHSDECVDTLVVLWLSGVAEKRYPQVFTPPCFVGAQPVRSLGAPPLGARMQPDGMPSIAGMHRTHALCVVRSVDVVWVRESMITGCVC